MEETIVVKSVQTGSPIDKVREYLALAVDIAMRRWLYVVAPVAITVVLAYIGVKLSPMSYSSKSLILIQSANRPVGGAGLQGTSSISRQVVVDQLAALEAWLKSDEVAASLLPRLVGPERLGSPEAIAAQMRIFRASLTMELVSAAAFELRLTGREPNGLAAKLELIMQRLLEGLIRPEQGILDSQQFIDVYRREQLSVAEAALSRAIVQAGLVDTDRIRDLLKQINDLKLQHINDRSSGQGMFPNARSEEMARTLTALRSQLTDDRKVIGQLELLYAEYHVARANSKSMNEGPLRNRNNYVGIFDSPENLLIVGRPNDPIYGERPAQKIAIAAILLSGILSVLFVGLLEFMQGRLVTTDQFASATGLPVVARIAAA